MQDYNDGIIVGDIDSIAYSDEYIKDLKYKDIVVDSLEKALALAENYKESGKYNWFRGQVGLWPLISSANRLNGEERNEAEEQLKDLIIGQMLMAYLKIMIPLKLLPNIMV